MIVNCPSCKRPLEVNFDSGAEEETLHAGGEEITAYCPECGEVRLPGDLGVTRLGEAGAVTEIEHLAHFSLLRLLGRGGFGTVWLAEDLNLGRQVALKVPVSHDRDVKSLLHEAKTAARLKHPNIVSVFEVGLEEGQFFIASEYIDGMTLRDYLTTGKPSTQRTVEILIAIAQALQHAHDHGVVHRDVKPANIILNQAGQPFVTDFGLAKKISADASISSEGQVLGTAKYMSPEQASGKTRETDHRTDIYALGVILFEMLTLHPPFRGNVRAIMHQKIFEDVPSPRILDPTIAKDLETICLKCLERDPDKRYQQAHELAAELGRFQSGEPILARPISTLEKGWRWCRKRPGVASLLTSLFLSLAIGLAGVSYFWMQAENNATIANRMFYRAQMKLALQFLDIGDADSLRSTLQPFKERQNMMSLRGFEWNYFDQQARIFKQVVSIDDPVIDVAISAQGDLFGGCGAGKELTIWETESGAAIQTLKLPAGRFNSLAFSPINETLATGTSDGKVRLWNPRSHPDVLMEAKHGPPVILVRFSPNGRLIATAGATGAVRLWDAVSLEQIAQIPTGKFTLKDFRFTADSTQLAIGTSNDFITFWKVDSQMILDRIGPCPLLLNFTFSDDGETLAVGTYSGEVLWYSMQSGELTGKVEAAHGAVGDIEFSKDASRLLVVKQAGELFVYEPLGQFETNRLTTHVLTFGTIDRTRNGKLIVTGSGDGTIKVLRMDQLTRPQVVWKDQHIRQIESLDNDGDVVTLIGDERVEMLSTRDLSSTPIPLELEDKLTSISVSPSGDLIAIAGMGSRVSLWDTKSKSVKLEIDTLEGGPTEVLFSNSGKHLAIANRAGEVWVYQVNQFDQAVCTWKTEGSKIEAIRFHPRGGELAVAYVDNHIELRDLSSPSAALTHSFQTSSIPLALSYCLQGQILIVGTNSGRLDIWNRESPDKLKSIKGHAARINCIVTFPDEKRFATGARDKLIKIWDIESGEQITSLTGHQKQIFTLAVSPDGNLLFSGGLEGDLRIWRGR